MMFDLLLTTVTHRDVADVTHSSNSSTITFASSATDALHIIACYEAYVCTAQLIACVRKQ